MLLAAAALALLAPPSREHVAFRLLGKLPGETTTEVLLVDSEQIWGTLRLLHERTALVVTDKPGGVFGLPFVLGDVLPPKGLGWPVGIVLGKVPPGQLLADWNAPEAARGAIFAFGPDPDIGALLPPAWHPLCDGTPCLPLHFDVSNYSSMLAAVRNPVTDLGGRPLKVTMFERQFTAFRSQEGQFTGFDGEMLHLLEELMNFEAQITKRTDDQQYGYKGEDGTFYGSLGDMVYRRADVSLNGFFAKYYGTKEIVFLPAVNRDRLCVTVPAALAIPDWKTVFLCFQPEVWTCIVGGYVASTIVWYLLKRVVDPIEPERTETAFSVYMILLLSPLPKLPENSSERIFVSSLMFSSFLLATCFQGSLLTLLSLQSYERETRTLGDLARSGLLIRTKSANLLDTFNGGDTEVLRTLRTRLGVEVTYKGEMIKKMLESRKLGSLGREFELKIKIGNHYSDGGGRALVHIVEECPRTYHICYSMPRGTLLYESFKRMLGLLLSSGIVEGPYVNRAHLTTGDRYTEKGTYEGARPFTLENLKIAFGFLVIGFALSMVAFLVELAAKRKDVIERTTRKIVLDSISAQCRNNAGGQYLETSG